MDADRTLNDVIITEVRGELARRDILHAEFAKTCGWTPMYFSRRMTGQVPWTADEIQILAKQLDLPLDHLTNPVRR